MSIGRRIEQIRKVKGWSQTELAKRSRLAPSAISQFEGGQRTPSTDALSRVADALDVSVDYLMGKSDGEDPLKEIPEFQTMYRNLAKLPEADQVKKLRVLNSVLQNLNDE